MTKRKITTTDGLSESRKSERCQGHLSHFEPLLQADVSHLILMRRMQRGWFSRPVSQLPEDCGRFSVTGGLTADILTRLMCSRRAALSCVAISCNSTGSILAKAQAQSSRTRSSNRLNIRNRGQSAPIIPDVKRLFDTGNPVEAWLPFPHLSRICRSRSGSLHRGRMYYSSFPFWVWLTA